MHRGQPPRGRRQATPHGARVEELLKALERIPEADHEAYLERICDDPEVRQDVLSLLAIEAESTGYVDRILAGVVPRRSESRDLTGRRVGAWRLRRPLGRGGMGVVYEADRADGVFEQRVALKLLTTALAGTEARSRFLAERRILAELEHPAIARILDGGVTEDGTPWFAMEYVEGDPIDAYCDRRRLSVRERLELFLQVCDAVEHAHRRLVVHRDLKPANVLVAEGDAPVSRAGLPQSPLPHDGVEGSHVEPSGGAPRVKLLDFGIAKLLGEEPVSEGAPPTRTSLRMMTPEYASPEQVRGEAVATASDVYQLGLVLYELLTGHRPYSLRARSASEIERVICRQAPTRLSTVLFHHETLKSPRSVSSASATTDRRSAATARERRHATAELVSAARPTPAESLVEEVCRVRDSSPSRLQRRLRGDLENIVHKALSKEPERRYGSADRLAQDVRRHLEGLPVTARPDTWAYRGRKFLERHTVGAVAAALALLFATGMTAWYTVGIQHERDRAEAERDRAESARRQAQVERDRAQAEAAKAQQMNQFLADLFRSADPREARGAEITMREGLDRGARRVDRELAGQPEVQADMLHVLGRTYLELGLYESAERMLSRTVEIRRRQLGPRHPDVAAALGELGHLRYRQGDYERARDRLREAVAMLQPRQTAHVDVLAVVLEALGETYRQLQDYERSLATLRRALAIQIQVSGEDSVRVADVLRTLGGLYHVRGNLEQAESHLARSLAIYERELDADHPLIGITLTNLAVVRKSRGEFDGLEDLYRRGLAIQEQAYGQNHARVGNVLNNLGDYLTLVGRNTEAVDVLQRALAVQITALGPDHPRVAFPLASLAEAHRAAGHMGQAHEYYKRCVAVRSKAFGRDQFDPALFHCVVGLARAQVELDDPVAAEQNLHRALTIWNRAPDTDDPRLTSEMAYLGRWLAEQQRCSDAVPLLERATRLESRNEATASVEASDLERLLASCS